VASTSPHHTGSPHRRALPSCPTRRSSDLRARTLWTAASKPLRGCSSTVRRPRTPATRRLWPPRSSRQPERSRAESPGRSRRSPLVWGVPLRAESPASVVGPLLRAESPASAVLSPSRRMDYYRVGADALSAHRLLSSVGRAPLL